MPRQRLEVEVPGGRLVGWVDGAGQQLLLLHGGPGLSADYLDGLIPELIPGYQVALYQQRGLSPSTEAGSGTVAEHLSDVRAVLDRLGWQQAYVAGHSWGGYLALHVAATMPARLKGILCIDSVGGAGDGGLPGFEATMTARTPAANRARARELDERAMRGEGTEREAVESFNLVWPAYFHDPATAPPVLPIRMSVSGYGAGYESMVNELRGLERRLPAISVPVGFVAGAGSPLSAREASQATAARIPGAWVDVVPNAGHFLWMEAPGVVRLALDRLVGSVLPTG